MRTCVVATNVFCVGCLRQPFSGGCLAGSGKDPVPLSPFQATRFSEAGRKGLPLSGSKPIRNHGRPMSDKPTQSEEAVARIESTPVLAYR